MQDPTSIDGLSTNELPAQLLTALGNAVVAVGPDLNGLRRWRCDRSARRARADWCVGRVLGRDLQRRELGSPATSCVDGRAVTGESRKTTETTLGRLADAAGLVAAEALVAFAQFIAVDAFRILSLVAWITKGRLVVYLSGVARPPSCGADLGRQMERTSKCRNCECEEALVVMEQRESIHDGWATNCRVQPEPECNVHARFWSGSYSRGMLPSMSTNTGPTPCWRSSARTRSTSPCRSLSGLVAASPNDSGVSHRISRAGSVVVMMPTTETMAERTRGSNAWPGPHLCPLPASLILLARVFQMSWIDCGSRWAG